MKKHIFWINRGDENIRHVAVDEKELDAKIKQLKSCYSTITNSVKKIPAKKGRQYLRLKNLVENLTSLRIEIDSDAEEARKVLLAAVEDKLVAAETKIRIRLYGRDDVRNFKE